MGSTESHTNRLYLEGKPINGELTVATSFITVRSSYSNLRKQVFIDFRMMHIIFNGTALSPHRLDSFLFYVIEWQHKFVALVFNFYFVNWQPAAAEPSAPPMTNETWHRQPWPRESPRVPKPGRKGHDFNDSKIADEESSDNEDNIDDHRRLEDAFYPRAWPPSTRSGGDAGVH